MAEQPTAKRPTTPPPTTLNDLPNNVLLHILTFLPLLSAIESSFISRKWRNLWHSMPSLNLKIDEFPHDPDSTPPITLQNFADFITQTLLNRPNTLPFHKFNLLFHYPYNHRYRSLVSSWLRYALDCDVVDVELNFGIKPINRNNDENGEGKSTRDDDLDRSYNFHFSDLRNRSVKCLTLWLCEIIVPSNNLIRFESIRDLTLIDVEIVDDLFSDLISRCNNLERLVLDQFHGLRKFRITSEKLKDLVLSCYRVENVQDFESSMEICAPNLSRIKIDYFYIANYNADLSSVVEAELEFKNREGYEFRCWSNAMSLLSGVEHLTIQNMLLTFIYSKIKSDECFVLKNLKHLELKTGYTNVDMVGLSLLLERSPLLETLVLDYVYQKDEDASFYDKFKTCPYDFDIPSLQEVKMKNFRFTDTEYYVLTLLKSQSVVLKKIVLFPAKLGETSHSGPLVLDLTKYADWTLVRNQLVPRGK